MKNKFNYFLLVLFILITVSCEDEMSKVTPKNLPSFEALNTESGIASLGKGGVYINGFGGTYSSIDDGLGTGFQLLVYGYHESMGDNIFCPYGNNDFKFLDNPTDIKLDDGSVVKMPIGSTQPAEIKLRNDRAYGATNSMLTEWTYMYIMNNAMNLMLENIDKVTYLGDGASKKAALKAWAHFWKGYAYSRIGSMYVSGLIIDEYNVTNGNFVTNTAIIAEAKNQFELAKTSLAAVTSPADYKAILSNVIPNYIGSPPSVASFIHNCNTMEARNILMNKKLAGAPGPLPVMTATDWANVKALTASGSGIGPTDGIFVIKTFANPSQSIIDPNFGAVGPYTTDNGSTYFISEKFIQDIRPGDQRLDQNFYTFEDVDAAPLINIRGRGINFGTRWVLADGGNGAFSDTYTYVHTSDYGVDNHYMAGSYEENRLMQAEALINTGDIPGGTALIDEVRTFQGAGLAAIVPGTLAQAMEEIRSERRVSLLFRSLAFYDARRWGIINDKSIGGGRGPGGALNVPTYDHVSGSVANGPIVLTATATAYLVNMNATFINYNYLNYWDVPKNELEFNTPASGSSVVVSPN